MNLRRKLHLFNNAINNSINLTRNTEDLYSLHLLNKVLHNGKFVPLTAMSLRPYVLAFILNELVINKRKSIIEFGSGISTVMLARMARMLNISPVIVSVDEDLGWHNTVRQMLIEEELLDKVNLFHVPLEEKNLLREKNHWYQNDLLKSKLQSFGKFDMVVIDGPTAYNDEIELSRYFAIPFLNDMLSDEHVIFLDDANRKGEQRIMHLWEKEYGKQFTIYAGTLGVSHKGPHFESNPMKFVIY